MSVQESPAEAWVNSGLLRSQGHWIQQSWELQHAGINPFGLRPNYREETLPLPSTANWIKDYWAWSHPTEQDPDSPTASPSHQEASTSLLSLSIRGRTEWKPQHRKLNKLITWITALSNSMKLWAMTCSATQNGWDMEESSDKTWSTGEGNANHFSILALRTPWTVWKGKKIQLYIWKKQMCS